MKNLSSKYLSLFLVVFICIVNFGSASAMQQSVGNLVDLIEDLDVSLVSCEETSKIKKIADLLLHGADPNVMVSGKGSYEKPKLPIGVAAKKLNFKVFSMLILCGAKTENQVENYSKSFSLEAFIKDKCLIPKGISIFSGDYPMAERNKKNILNLLKPKDEFRKLLVTISKHEGLRNVLLENWHTSFEELLNLRGVELDDFLSNIEFINTILILSEENALVVLRAILNDAELKKMLVAKVQEPECDISKILQSKEFFEKFVNFNKTISIMKNSNCLDKLIRFEIKFPDFIDLAKEIFNKKYWLDAWRRIRQFGGEELILQHISFLGNLLDGGLGNKEVLDINNAVEGLGSLYGIHDTLSNAMKNYPGQLNYESFMWLINNTNLWYKDFRYSYNDKPENMRATAGIFSFVMQNYQVLMEERNRPIFEWLFEVKYSEDGRFKNGLKNIDAVVDQSKACLLLRALKIEGAAGNIGNISILFNADTAFLRGLAENEDEEALRQAIFELKIDGNEDGDERRGVKRRFFSTYLDNYGPLLTEIGHFKSSVDQLRSTINMEQDYVKRLQDEIRLLMLNNNDASVEGNPDIDNPEERNEKLNALVQRLNGQMTLQQGMVTKLQAQIDSKTAPLGKCVFCQEDLVFFEDGSNAALKITKAKCGLHTFHEKCVLAALTHGVDACPLCNKPDTLS